MGEIMFPTVEMRWFYPGTIPANVLAWFAGNDKDDQVPARRVDHYLPLFDTDALGIKLREGRVEVKQRRRSFGEAHLHEQVSGQMEHWRKWSFALAPEQGAETESWTAVHKERWLRRYYPLDDGRLQVLPVSIYPERACDLEITNVRARGQAWWTLCFEAFGPEPALKALLVQVSGQILKSQPPPVPLTVEASYSYPRWLAEIRHNPEA